MFLFSGPERTSSPPRRPSLHSLRSSRRPNRLWSLVMVLQFQRWLWNWCWHSVIQSFIPAPMACITWGCWRHSCRCLLTRPGMLSHITCEPRVPMYLQSRRTRGRDGELRVSWGSLEEWNWNVILYLRHFSPLHILLHWYVKYIGLFFSFCLKKWNHQCFTWLKIFDFNVKNIFIDFSCTVLILLLLLS